MSALGHVSDHCACLGTILDPRPPLRRILTLSPSKEHLRCTHYQCHRFSELWSDPCHTDVPIVLLATYVTQRQCLGLLPRCKPIWSSNVPKRAKLVLSDGHALKFSVARELQTTISWATELMCMGATKDGIKNSRYRNVGVLPFNDHSRIWYQRKHSPSRMENASGFLWFLIFMMQGICLWRPRFIIEQQNSNITISSGFCYSILGLLKMQMHTYKDIHGIHRLPERDSIKRYDFAWILPSNNTFRKHARLTDDRYIDFTFCRSYANCVAT